MIMYRRRRSQPLKWVIALIIFILAMTITFDDVSGINVPKSGNASADQQSEVYDQPGNEQTSGKNAPGIPEPGTLILVGVGIGAMYILRRRKM